jgi:hypothetical protein
MMEQEDIIFQDWFDKSKLSIKFLSSNPNINVSKSYTNNNTK